MRLSSSHAAATTPLLLWRIICGVPASFAPDKHAIPHRCRLEPTWLLRPSTMLQRRLFKLALRASRSSTLSIQGSAVGRCKLSVTLSRALAFCCAAFPTTGDGNESLVRIGQASNFVQTMQPVSESWRHEPFGKQPQGKPERDTACFQIADRVQNDQTILARH